MVSSAAAQGGTYADGGGAAPGITPGRGREVGPVERHEEIRDFNTSLQIYKDRVLNNFTASRTKTKKYNPRYVVKKVSHLIFKMLVIVIIRYYLYHVSVFFNNYKKKNAEFYIAEYLQLQDTYF